VGDYIAAAVLSIAFHQPFAVVDGNVKRVLARLFCLTTPSNDTRSKSGFQEISNQLLNPADPGNHNQAMMELGAMICTPRNPRCAACPVAEFCRAFRDNKVPEFPKKKNKAPIPEYRIAVGVIYRNGRMLITRRRENGLLGGLWEFPGGKIHDDETAENACLREIAEETGLRINILRPLKTVRHAYTHFKIIMQVFICEYKSGEVWLNGPVDYRWITAGQIEDYPFPKSNHKFMNLLQTKNLDY